MKTVDPLTSEAAHRMIEVVRERLSDEMPPRTVERFSAPDPELLCSITTEDSVIAFVSPAYIGTCHYSEKELIGETHRIVRSGYQSAIVYEQLHDTLLEGKSWWGEFCNRTKLGTLFWLEAFIAPVDHEGHRFNVALYRDITAGHRTHSPLQLHDLVLEQMADAVLIADAGQPDYPVIYANEAWSRLTGYSVSEVVGRNCRFLQGASTLAETVDTLRNALKAGSVFHEELLNYRKDGTPFWNELEIHPVNGADGAPTHFVATCKDVTERRRFRAQRDFEQDILEKLARAKKLDSVLEEIVQGIEAEFMGLKVAVYLVDRPDNCLRPHCAPSLPEPFVNLVDGVPVEQDELLCAKSIACDQVVIEEDFDRIAPGPFKNGVNSLGLRSGWSIPISSGGGSAVGSLMIYCPTRRAPTESELEFCQLAARLAAIAIERLLDDEMRSHLERQLRRAQKMEAVGTLAGGIAHDFNNILTGIFGFVQLAREDLPEDHSAQGWLEEVMAAGMRARDVVRQILTFSRQQEQEVAPCDLAVITEEAVKLIRAVLPATIELTVKPSAKLPVVRADPVQVHQALVNICTNAWHAMTDGTGAITISVVRRSLPAEDLVLPTELEAGEYVCIAVTDTGEGMPADMLDRIFEPFFTTKAPGKGSGLGLSVVHGIMQAQGGAVMVQSALGEGSTFYLAFPTVEDISTEAPQEPPQIMRGSGQRLLVVDDEQPIVGWLRALLKRCGYEVDGFGQPIDALEAFQANPSAYDMVLTDLTMPGLTGVDLARKIKAIRDDLPIVIMSGYDDIAAPEMLADVGVAEVLRKPLMAETLTNAIQRVLVARSS